MKNKKNQYKNNFRENYYYYYYHQNKNNECFNTYNLTAARMNILREKVSVRKLF